MKANVSLQSLWFNTNLLNFFFRKQAQETLQDLIDSVHGREDEKRFQELSDRIEDVYGDDLDGFEEDCYNLSWEEIKSNLGYYD